MNKIVKIQPVMLTYKILDMLERKELIRTLRPSKYILGTKPKSGRMEKIYTSHPQFGGHKMINIGLDNDVIKLNYHPDNEEFIFVKDPKYKCKDIYLAMGLHKYRVMEKKAQEGSLTDKDIMLIKWPYNDPKSCIFTMLKDAVHCEYVHPGKGKPPYFFVTEPARLKMYFIKMNGYKIQADF